MRKMAQKMIAIAVAMVIVLGMASVTQMDTLAASYSFEGEAHVQTYGDRAGVYRNNTLILGTTGQAKRLERIKIKFNNQTGYDGSIEYRVHRQTYGWTNWVKNNQFAGTKGEAKRLEGIQIRLTGEIAEHYSIRYRVHIQTYGWSQGWQYDGALAGTEGEAKRLESLEVQLVPKSETMGLVYRVHRQTYGWETSYKTMGQVSGTTGEGKRLEGIEIALTGNEYSGSIEYSTHVQSYGWMNEVSNGMMSGTSGQAKRLEAIRIRLKGEIANHYNICYRVHAQTYGWLSWAWNGDPAGTSGLGKRLEAIQIVLVKKDDGVLTDLNGIKSKAAFPYITPHDCKWKTVVDEPAHETPIYEEQDVYEWHSMWPDGSYADELLDPCAKQRWCAQHVSAASRIVRTQTQLEDVLLASLMVKYGLVLKKYRLVQDITMLLRTRSAVSVALESSNHKQKSKPPVSKPRRLGRLSTRITNTNTTRKTNIHF